MKLFLCQSFETSDDEDEEEVSEEEQQEESFEDEDGDAAADSNAAEDLQADTGDANGIEYKPFSASSSESKVAHNGDSNILTSKSDESQNDSDASVSTDAEINVKNVNGKLDINGVKPEELYKKSKLTPSKSLINTNSVATAASVPARLKNVSTEMMVFAAIRNLNERGGSSAIAIKKYIMNNYPQLDGPRTLMLIKKFIKKALENGKLVQAKGTGLGGSFKVSAEMNRLDEQKKRQGRKKIMQKAKKDAAAGETEKMSKASTKVTKKKAETGEKKITTAKKTAKAKTTKTSIKIGDNADPVEKAPKASASTKKVAKATNKIQTKITASKETKSSAIANNKPAEKSKTAKQSQSAKVVSSSATNGTSGKPKRGAPTKNASTLAISEAPTSPPKTVSKFKPEATPRKKPTARGKAAATEVAEMSAGDADAVKTAKKPVAKKGKAK